MQAIIEATAAARGSGTRRRGRYNWRSPSCAEVRSCPCSWSPVGVPTGLGQRGGPEAYVEGVSTRRVDDLVRAMGVDGMDKSTVSRLAAVLDEDVRAFRERPLTEAYPYLWLDATFPQGAGGGTR